MQTTHSHLAIVALQMVHLSISSTSLLSQLPKPLQQGVGRHSRGARGLGAEHTAPHVWQRVFIHCVVAWSHQGLVGQRHTLCILRHHAYVLRPSGHKAVCIALHQQALAWRWLRRHFHCSYTPLATTPLRSTATIYIGSFMKPTRLVCAWATGNWLLRKVSPISSTSSPTFTKITT